MSSVDNLFNNVSSKNNSIKDLFQISNKLDTDKIKLDQNDISLDQNDNLEANYYQKLEEPKQEETPQHEARTPDLKKEEIDKAQRTIFIGNVPTSVITSKTSYKTFKKLFTPKEGQVSIESIRFRSIAFEETLPRKIAFAKQSFHKNRLAVNAYVVYSNPSQIQSICSTLNTHLFENRHLRVDSISHPAPHDKQRSVFVGNLDFEEDEEPLWTHFKNAGDIEYVRIIRDAKTNLGKGFAYVQFKQLESVNKALLLNDKPMTSNATNKTRKLRVSRCKTVKRQLRDGAPTHSMTDSQRTKFGRAKKMLNKADRATLGKTITIEGQRAQKNGKGTTPSSLLKKRKQRSKDGRVTKRSIAFKKAQLNK